MKKNVFQTDEEIVAFNYSMQYNNGGKSKF